MHATMSSACVAFRTASAMCCRRPRAMARCRCPDTAGLLSRRSHNTRARDTGGSSSGDAAAAGGQAKQLLLDKAKQINPAVGAAALVLGGALSARFVYSQLLGSDSSGTSTTNRHGPRRDESRVTVKISTAAYDRARASSAEQPLTPQRLADGSKHDNVTIDNQSAQLQSVDAAAFAAFVSRQQRELRSAKEQSQMHCAQVLHEELAAHALSDVEGRIGSFADWYFGYSTQYSLLGIAMASAGPQGILLGRLFLSLSLSEKCMG